jgi:hypothetical protein
MSIFHGCRSFGESKKSKAETKALTDTTFSLANRLVNSNVHDSAKNDSLTQPKPQLQLARIPKHLGGVEVDGSPA